MEVDLLAVISGDDFVVNENITVHQPSLREIKEFGEKRFFNMIYTICAIPSDVKSQLWDNGIDYMEISDFELFILYTRNMTSEDTKLILGDLDLSAMEIELELGEDEKKIFKLNKVVLNEETQEKEIEFSIDEDTYMKMIKFIRSMCNIVPKVEKAANKFTKRILINESRRNLELNKNKPFSSVLHSLIISLVNTEEFPYDYKSIMNITLYQIMKSSYQIQTKKQSCALLQGSMSGFVDTSKLDKNLMNWMYDGEKTKNN